MDGQYLPDDEIDIDSLASSEPPEYVPQMFSDGGEVEEEDIEYYAKGGEASFDQSVQEMNKYLLADEADTAYAPMYPSEPKASERDTKTAKLMLKQLSTKSGGGGKSKRSKEMSLATGDLSPAIPELGAPPTEQEKLTQIATARSQYDALEKAYKLKAQAAQRAGKGLMKPTFNTVMFDQPTLEKAGPLMARTFQLGGLVGMAKGGEANKEDLPGLYGVSDYAREESANMFPEEKGQWDRQDSARHMLAAATLARKYGPRAAELAGQAHEFMASPLRFIGSKMGVMKESPDYAQDIHNNRLGIELASKSKSQEELLALVRQMALQAREGQAPGKASTGKPTGASDNVGRYGSQGPVKPIKMAMGGLPFAPTAMVRPSTRAELDEIKSQYEEYDRKAAVYNAALEKYKADVYVPYNAQADAYNAALEKYKAEQFNPYQTQVDTYNAALEKYRVEQFNPYQAQIDAYNAALNKYNAEIYAPYSEAVDRYNADNAAPVPVAPADFSMAVPTAPAQFGMTAPVAPAQFGVVMPTKPADFAQPVPTVPSVSAEDYQAKMVAAKKEAANRQLALNVAMDPEAYNLSMPKLFANGGPVHRADGSPDTGERMTPQQIERLAADQVALNTYQPVMNTNIQRQGAKSRKLATERDINQLPDPQTYAFIQSALLGTPPDEVVNKFSVVHPKRKEILGRAEQGFVAGNVALIGPAARMLKEVGTPVAKFLGKEAARQVERGIFNEGPLRGITPQPMYISRPPGGYFPTSRGMAEKTAEEINNTKLSDLPENFVSWLSKDDKQKGSFLGLGPKESIGQKYSRWKTETGDKDYTFGILSGVDKSLQPVLKKITEMESGEKRDALFQMFNQKAKDFYSKQAGSVQDPLRADILSGRFKFDEKSQMGDVFPQVLVKQAAQGNLQALRLLEKNYDDMIDIRATVPYRQGQAVPDANTLKSQIIESVRDNLDSIPDSQLLAYAGKKPLPGPDGVAKAATEIRLKLKENPNLFSTVLEPNIERTVFARQSNTSDLNLAQYPNSGPTATKAMVNPQRPALTKEELDKMETLPRGYYLPEMEAAIDKSQPILDANQYGNLKLLGLTPNNLLQEANKISAKDLKSMGFTDFLKKAYTSTQEIAQLEKDLEKVKPLLRQGKNPPAKAMLFGVTDFLPTVNSMRWVKVTDPDGVKSIAAGMNNSIGSYATSNVYGALGRGRRALDSGEVEIYALYDKNHTPHVTVEYGTGKSSVPEKQRRQILELTGNGPLTANELSRDYAEQIADLVNKLPIKNATALPAKTQKVLKDSFFEFKGGKYVRNEEEFSKFQETKKELGLAKGGVVDKNTAFIKAHT